MTALRMAERKAREQAARFEVLLQMMPVAVFSYDTQGRCTFARGSALHEFGHPADELVGVSLFDTYADVPELVAALASSLAGQEGKVSVELGDRTWQCHLRSLTDASGAVTGGVGVVVDVTALAHAERDVRANEVRLRSLLRHAFDVALVLDETGRIVYVSPAAELLFGYAQEQLFWRVAIDFNHPDDRSIVASAWKQVLERPGATARYECRMLHADGTWRWADHVLTNLVDDPAVGGVVANVRETTERRRAEQELRRLALQDGLTGLANRALLLDRIAQALAWGRRSESQTGLVVFDVVGMRGINAAVGQEGGDAVLREVAQRLRAGVRATDSVARVGGDQFAVLVEDVASAEDLRARAAALLETVDEPVLVDGAAVDVRLAAGSALSPAVDAGALLVAAEHAVHHGTADSRVEVRQAETEQRQSTAGAAAAADLRRAIEQHELRLHFQPVLRLDTGEVAGVEALVRWQHPHRGLVSASEFIGLAERSGLVVELGEWVLREACRCAAAWQADGRHVSVGVNLSPRQLVGTDFRALLGQVLQETGARPDLLVLEVTESTLMDAPGAVDVLAALREMGVHLALDDFGTGYSSLTYLKRFPLDAIKIDRSFVSGLGRDADDEAIVASVVSLARALGKLVIAEGVETVAQLEALRALGVDQAQGFLWTRPLPRAELDVWLAERRRLHPGLDVPRPAAPQAATATATTATTAAVAAAVGSDQARILVLHRQGASLHTVAAALNAEGRRTSTGPRWTPTSVARVIAALGRSV